MQDEILILIPEQGVSISVDDIKNNEFRSVHLAEWGLTIYELLPSNIIKKISTVFWCFTSLLSVVAGIVIFTIYRNFLIQHGETDGVRNVPFEIVMPAISGILVFFVIFIFFDKLFEKVLFKKGYTQNAVIKTMRIKNLKIEKTNDNHILIVSLEHDRNEIIVDKISLMATLSNQKALESLKEYEKRIKNLKNKEL
jgi:hypothetical protein